MDAKIGTWPILPCEPRTCRSLTCEPSLCTKFGFVIFILCTRSGTLSRFCGCTDHI